MLGNHVLLPGIMLREFRKMQLSQQTKWKHKKVLNVHTSHLTCFSSLNFSLKLVTLMCVGSFQLELPSKFKPTSRNHRATKLLHAPNITHVLKSLDPNRSFALALELQLCLSSFLNTDRLEHCFECLLPLGLKSPLFRKELSKLETKYLIFADLSLLKPAGPCTDLKIWSDHAKEVIRLDPKIRRWISK